LFFFFTDTATTAIYTLSLHDALPIFHLHHARVGTERETEVRRIVERRLLEPGLQALGILVRHVRGQRDLAERHRLARKALHLERSEEHTSELQSRGHLVCRLLLEKKK